MPSPRREDWRCASATNSNLTLDPDLDTYYVQDIVVGKLPTFLGHLGEAQRLLREAAAPAAGHGARVVMLDSLLRSTTDAIETNLAAAYRGNIDGKLKPAVEENFARMISEANSHLGRVKSIMSAGQATTADAPSPDPVYASAMQSAIDAWTVSHSELDRLLQQRIDALLGKLRLSLLFIGLATCLSMFIAFMTYWHIVRPLQRLEKLARTVRETKDYSLRTDISSHDEIGRLGVAFNDMLSELAKAREREVADQARAGAVQSELARVTRLTTMGEMAATVAHEINQPLAAIVANGNAGLRWLKNKMPDLEEVEQSLKRIVKDGHRAGETIRSIRGMLRKTSQAKTALDVNELVRGVIALAHNELAKHRVQVQTALSPGLPPVLADRAQLQQVMWNLIVNAAESIGFRRGPRANTEGEIGDARRRQRAPHGGGLRHRHRPARSQPDLRGFLHDEVQRHRDGTVDLPVDRRIPWREPFGVRRQTAWIDFQSFAADVRAHGERRAAAAREGAVTRPLGKRPLRRQTSAA